MKVTNLYDRRDFLAYCSLTAAGLLVGCRSREIQPNLDAFIHDKMDRNQIPGLAAAIIDYPDVVWSKGYGWADIDHKVEMTPDTLQNIGSIFPLLLRTGPVFQSRGTGNCHGQRDFCGSALL